MDGELTVLGTVTVPGIDRSVPLVRRFVCTALGPVHPCLDDVRLCVSELATNALKHSTSGLPGGLIDVLIAAELGLIRVEVTDDGAHGFSARPPAAAGGARTCATPAPGTSDGADEAESGRGLPIVDALAARWGVRPDGHRTTVWAEFAAT